MKKINISICQSIEEIKFIIKKIKPDKDILWIPLNLETFLYFKKKILTILTYQNILQAVIIKKVYQSQKNS